MRRPLMAFNITVKASEHGGQGSSTPSHEQTIKPVQDRAVRPPLPMVAQIFLFRSGRRLETGSSTWQRIGGVFQSQMSHLTCYLTNTPNKRPLRAIGR
jgi:hypothetical protein